MDNAIYSFGICCVVPLIILAIGFTAGRLSATRSIQIISKSAANGGQSPYYSNFREDEQ
jgi:hypothetical protein